MFLTASCAHTIQFPLSHTSTEVLVFTADESFWCDNYNYSKRMILLGEKNHIALYICFHFTHICAAMWKFYFIKLVFSVLNICAFSVCLVFFCILYIFMVSVANSHTINCIQQKVWKNHSDLSFKLSAGHLVGHLTHPWIKLLNGLLIKDYFAAFCFSQDLE